MPSWLAAMTLTSPSRLWRDAAYTPSASATTTVSAIDIAASGSVTRSRSAISVAGGRVVGDAHRVRPCSRPPIHSP